MELKHELLEVLEKAKQGTTSACVKYLQDKDHLELLADIEALLAIQRQECADKAIAYPCADVDPNGQLHEYYEISKQSILNAKLF